MLTQPWRVPQKLHDQAHLPRYCLKLNVLDIDIFNFDFFILKCYDPEKIVTAW